MTVSDIAKKRFEKYVGEVLKDENDLAEWEYYTYLLEQAKNHKVDRRGYMSVEYQADRDTVREIRKRRAPGGPSLD
jgi:hypothetical protein